MTLPRGFGLVAAMDRITSSLPAPPVIVTVAPIDYRHLDLFPSGEALVRDICDCQAEGAAVVHFHATDAAGQATNNPAFFDDVVARVRDTCDIVIQGSTGGVGVPWEVRTAALAARDLEMASLNMGSCNLFGRAYINTPDDIARLGARMHEAGIVPDMCFFEPGFFTSLRPWQQVQSAGRRPVCSICLGFPDALPASMENLVVMVSKLPPGAEWTLVHHGAPDCALLAAAIAAGGNIRVGFEDSRAFGGAGAARNAELVASVRVLIEQLGRRVATPAEVRRRYGIRPIGDQRRGTRDQGQQTTDEGPVATLH